MPKIFEWIGITLGALVGLVLVLVISLIVIGTYRLNKTYDIHPQTITIPADEDAIARGKYLSSSYCAGCHGENLAGMIVFEDPSLGTVPAPNLTTGNGGIGTQYSDSDYMRAIRYGVDEDGRPLIVMPSGAFNYFSD